MEGPSLNQPWIHFKGYKSYKVKDVRSADGRLHITFSNGRKFFVTDLLITWLELPEGNGVYITDYERSFYRRFKRGYVRDKLSVKFNG